MDRLDADPGLWDVVSFADSTGPIQLDLKEGSAMGQGRDVLVGIDDLRGSRFDDVLLDVEGWNDIEGLGGDDVIIGGDGGDFLQGGPGDDRTEGDRGNDSLYGDKGHDHLDGGPGRDGLYNYWGGTDECVAGEVVRFLGEWRTFDPGRETGGGMGCVRSSLKESL